jgi:hypothetical protein
MIRILTADEPGAITITIDGKLVGEYVDEVEASIRRAMDPPKKIRLFLRNVVHMDDAGRCLLSRLAAQGVELSASGIYSSYVVAHIVK